MAAAVIADCNIGKQHMRKERKDPKRIVNASKLARLLYNKPRLYKVRHHSKHH